MEITPDPIGFSFSFPNPIKDFIEEMNRRSGNFEYHPGPSEKIAFWGYGTSTFMNVGGSMALGAKSLLWQGVGRIAAVGSVVGIAFTTGLLIGRGLDYTPTLFGGETLSFYLGKEIFSNFGPAPAWAHGLVDFFS